MERINGFDVREPYEDTAASLRYYLEAGIRGVPVDIERLARHGEGLRPDQTGVTTLALFYLDLLAGEVKMPPSESTETSPASPAPCPVSKALNRSSRGWCFQTHASASAPPTRRTTEVVAEPSNSYWRSLSGGAIWNSRECSTCDTPSIS